MYVKGVVFCASIVFIVFVVYESEALEVGDEGACGVRISSTQMRKKSYSVLVWRNGKRRAMRRYKNEPYTTWTNHTICCQGYQHNSELDTCSPVCSTGCLSGKCIAPSTCHCEAPLYLDPERLNACLTPTCDPPCFNSICNINNICECEHGARRYNKTHCANCDDQHEINPDLSCKPVCEQCLNGECTAPNTCTCFDGYELHGQSCDPVCKECVNSTCTAPNICTCLEGYEQVNETTCAPKCDSCINGACVSPGQCECPSGYSLEDGSCRPQCEMDCDNGYCSAPNVCSCAEGYVERFPGVCLKPCRPECGGVCDLEGECDGVCTTVEL